MTPAVEAIFFEQKVYGVYAQNIKGWNVDGLLNSKMTEYEDINQCADAFLKIVDNNIIDEKTVK